MKKRKIFQNFKLHMADNRGISLVTVIIIIGFVGILVSTLMLTSMINLKMKQVNRYSKDTFYSAEQVLDEINVGLQRYVSDALGNAYQDVLVNYMTYPTEQKLTILQTNYYENLWSYLQADASHKTYDLDVIRGFVKESTLWRGTEEDGYGAIIVSGTGDTSLNDATGVMETYDKKGVVLKNLRVYYKDSKGFVSIIQTDICLAMPDFEFAPSTDLPDIPSHSIIADEGLFFGNENADGTLGAGLSAGSSLSIDGDVYADRIVVSQTDKNSKISLNQVGDSQFVVRNDIKLKHGSFSNEEGSDVWANDILADSSDVSLLGDSNIANDLNIKGDGSQVTLGKVYNGYGNSMTEAAKSSAILINGINASLDLTGLETITIAGHAFIGTKKNNDGGYSGSVVPEEERKNVYTGESIAVKSNQLLYLIPGECIGVNKVNGQSLYNKNPLSREEYLNITGNEKYQEFSENVVVEKLGDSLSSYIQHVNGVPKPEKVFVRSNDENQGLVYYYMSFDNETAANLYFAKMFNNNFERAGEYARAYVDALTFPNTQSALRLRLAGSSIQGTRTEGYTLMPTVISDANNKLEDNKLIYSQRFEALCTKLITNYHELSGVEKSLSAYPDEGIVFDNIVDDTKLKEFVKSQTGSETGSVLIKGEDFGSTAGNVIVATKDVNISATDKDVHLVITSKDVTISNPNYTGAVLSNGTVRVLTSNGNFKADVDTVSALLRYSVTDGTNHIMVANILRGGSEYIFASLDGDEIEDSTALKELVVYENWKKE